MCPCTYIPISATTPTHAHTHARTYTHSQNTQVFLTLHDDLLASYVDVVVVDGLAVVGAAGLLVHAVDDVAVGDVGGRAAVQRLSAVVAVPPEGDRRGALGAADQDEVDSLQDVRQGREHTQSRVGERHWGWGGGRNSGR